jgi:hypothetical protein
MISRSIGYLDCGAFAWTLWRSYAGV